MPHTFRIARPRGCSAVSDDTVRRWIDQGLLRPRAPRPPRSRRGSRERAVALADEPDDPTGVSSSARNRFVGIVTRVRVDGCDGAGRSAVRTAPRGLAHVGRSAEELGLEPGALAVASVKADRRDRGDAAGLIGREAASSALESADEEQWMPRPSVVAERTPCDAPSASPCSSPPAPCSPAARLRPRRPLPRHPPSGLSGTVEVYAAASLQRSFDEVASAFETAHPGVTVSAVYDGSSTLATQIGEGAPAMSSPRPTRRTWRRSPRRRPTRGSSRATRW